MINWQGLYADRVAEMRASDIRDAFRLSEQPDIISFAGGFPTSESFPTEQLMADMQRVLTQDAASALQYGPTEGILELRKVIAQNMCSEGVECTYENILVTNGSQQALDLICKLFINPFDPMLVELPAYIGGLNAALNYQARFIGIPLDNEGLNTQVLAEQLANMQSIGARMPKLIYVVPNFHNPTGVTMSQQRREHLLELANHYNFLVIEDNPYGKLRYEGNTVPHIKVDDTQQRVLYLGSYSKVFLPGLRLGWVVAAKPIIQKMTVAKQGTDLCTNTLGQKLACEFTRTGALEPHAVKLRQIYRRKRDLAINAMQKHFPSSVHWTVPQGGFFTFVTLPAWMDAKALLAQAVAEEKVAYVPGGAFYVDNSGKNTIRLAYSQASDEDLLEGITRLGRFFHKVIASQSGQTGASALAC